MTSKRTFLIKVTEPNQVVYSTVFATDMDDALIEGRVRWPVGELKVMREVKLYKTHCEWCEDLP